MSDDPFEVLRRMAGDPVPTDADRLRAWTRLENAIDAEGRSQRRRWLVPVAAAAVVAIAVAAVVVVSRPNPVEAALGEIAAAARLATPEEIPEGSFLYTRTEGVGLGGTAQGDLLGVSGPVYYFTPAERQSWRHGDFVQAVTTIGTPTFLDPEVEAAYYAHGWDKRDHVGETITRQFTGVTNDITDRDWPTDPRQLREALDEAAREGGLSWPLEYEVFGLATDLLRENDPGSDVRAALMEVFAGLPLTLVDQTSDGSITLAATFDVPNAQRFMVTLNAQGYLVAETQTYLEEAWGIPAGTRVSDAIYSVPTVVDDLDTPQP
jgi:hypothetical protein